MNVDIEFTDFSWVKWTSFPYTGKLDVKVNSKAPEICNIDVEKSFIVIINWP